MRTNCQICNSEIQISLGDWFRSRWNPQICLCSMCKDIEKWKDESLLIRGASVTSRMGIMEIHKYSPDLYATLAHELIGKRCAIRLKDKRHVVCTVTKVENGYLSCVKEDLSGTSEAIPICNIECYEVISENCTKYVNEIETPVKGYKGVLLTNGVLGDEKYIYEIGIPYVEKRKDPFSTDYQDTYSHFCIRIEDVLGWGRNFISSPINYSTGIGESEYRLFEVEAKGHCFQNTSSGWVSNNLTLVREVPQEEIYAYFINRSSSSNEAITPEIMEHYRTSDIKPYRNDLSRVEVKYLQKELLARNYGREVDASELEYTWNYDLRAHCSYLMLRADIQSNCFTKESEEYRFLVDYGYEREIASLHRLLKIS